MKTLLTTVLSFTAFSVSAASIIRTARYKIFRRSHNNQAVVVSEANRRSNSIFVQISPRVPCRIWLSCGQKPSPREGERNPTRHTEELVSIYFLCTVCSLDLCARFLNLYRPFFHCRHLVTLPQRLRTVPVCNRPIESRVPWQTARSLPCGFLHLSARRAAIPSRSAVPQIDEREQQINNICDRFHTFISFHYSCPEIAERSFEKVGCVNDPFGHG